LTKEKTLKLAILGTEPWNLKNIS